MDPAVARARAKAEKATEVYIKEFRRRVDEYFDRLRDTTTPPMNPIQDLCDLLGLSRSIAAGAFNYSYGRWSNILAGGIESVPTTVLRVVEKLGGPNGCAEFEASWARFRANLGVEARRTLEKRLFPAGPGHMAS